MVSPHSTPHDGRGDAESSDAQSAAIRQLNELVLGATDSTHLMTDLARLATRVVATSGRRAATEATAGESVAGGSTSAGPAVSDPVSCGITVRYAEQLVTVSSSDVRAELLDETQYQSHAGPCLQSLENAEVVESPDTADETRWPEYSSAAAEAGLRCSLSIPLSEGGKAFGALNLYGFSGPHQFGPEARQQLELFADQAGLALGTALGRLRTAGSTSPADQAVLAEMDQALEHRTVMNQAVGIIMGEQSCTGIEALAQLERRADASQRNLHEVAAELVERATG